MKKYGKLIVLTLFIVSIFSAFYIINIVNAKKLPQFDIQTVSGDEKIADDFIIKGMFGRTMFSEDFFRTEDGVTKYGRNTSFINHDKLFFDRKELLDLQKKYRKFMRGKDSNLDAYYENEDKLVFATVTYDYLGVGDYKFEIDVLDKEKNKSISSFTHHIPDRQKYWSIEPVHTQLINDQLKIVTVNDLNSGEHSQEAHVYSFDLKEETLISDDIIASFKANKHEEGYESMSLVNKSNSDDPQIMLYMEQVTYLYPNENNENPDDYTSHYEEQNEVEKLLIYDLATKTTEEIDLQEEFEQVSVPFYTDGDSVYLGKVLINKLLIEKYDLKEGKVTDTLDIETNISDVDQNNIVHAHIDDNKLYYAPSYSAQYVEEPFIIVIDLVTMETIYEGIIQLKNGVLTEDMYLYLDPLEIK